MSVPIPGCMMRKTTCAARNCGFCGFNEREYKRRQRLLKKNGLSVNEKGLHYLNVTQDNREVVVDPIKLMTTMGISLEKLQEVMV